MKTVTLVSDNFSENSIVNTYPISIGLKSDQHTAVESYFIKEIEDLANGKSNNVYCILRRKNVTAHF